MIIGTTNMKFIYLDDYLKSLDIILCQAERDWLDDLQRGCADLERYTLIYAFCKYKKCNTYLEIGCADGWGMKAAQEAGAEILGIDIRSKLKESVIIGKSKDILPTFNRKFDLIFVDGNHDYPYVKDDIRWAMNNGKYVFIHDYNLEKGVIKAIDELYGKPELVIMDIKKSKKPYNYGIIIYAN